MSYLWSDPAFLDFACREPFSLPPTQLGTSCIDPTGYPRSLNLLSRILHRLAAEPQINNTIIPPWLRSALGRAQHCFGLGSGNPAWDSGCWTRLATLIHSSPSQMNDQVTALTTETIARLNGLQPGGVCVLPGGVAVDVDKPPIFLLFIICRPEDRAHFFEFAVVNASGYGTEFHAFQISDQWCSGSVERDLLLVLEDVIPERALHSSFWVSVYRLLIRPAPTNVNTLYSILLPHLNCRPLFSNWIPPSSQIEANQVKLSLSKDFGAITRHGNRGGAWYVAPALRTPGSCVPGALACLHYVLQTTCQLNQEEIRVVMILLCWAICLSCRDDLALVTSDSSTLHNYSQFHLTVVKCAMRNFAQLVSNHALRHADGDLGLTPSRLKLTSHHFALFESLLNSLDKILTERQLERGSGQGGQAALPDCLSSSSFTVPLIHTVFPLFGRFRNDLISNLDELAGQHVKLPLVIPVDLASVQCEINSLFDVCTALRRAQEACTLLSNQQDLMHHTYSLRFKLIQHLILEVIPMPLAFKDRQRETHCFWARQQLRREMQIDLLRTLFYLARHFVTSIFSLHNTRHIDAQRVTVLAGFCCLADVILRLPTVDNPSPLGAHYSGRAEGPIKPFVFDISFFADQSEFFLMTDPTLNTSRTQILDYLADLRSSIDDDHVIFNFEEKMELGKGDSALLEQVSLQFGFNTRPDTLLLYFTGEQPDFIDLIPEWIYFRDIVFYFKALMAPDASTLPRLRRWALSDARLRWAVTPGKQQLSVRGFGMLLECVAFVKKDYYERRHGEGILTKFLGWLGMAARRVPPSAADPTNLVEGGEHIETEDDVLHLKKLPQFGGRLSAQDTEVLLQYLTAPYIRIPLVLQFFAEESRLDSLVCRELQHVLMAVLFEPSLWQRQRFKEAPEEIPTKSRAPLSTPLGLLFNELTYSPDTILQALEDMLDIAIDKDTGQYIGHTADLLLFVVRVVVGVDRYISFIIKHSTFWEQERRKPDDQQKLFSCCGYKSLARGLQLARHDYLEPLLSVHRHIESRLRSEVLPLLESWALKAIKKSDLTIACTLYAHVASIFAHIDAKDYNESVVSCLITSLFVVFTRHRFALEPNKRFQSDTARDTVDIKEGVTGETLGVPDMELFGVLQSHRQPLLQWIESHPVESDRVMEALIRIVSFTGDRTGHGGFLDLLQNRDTHDSSIETDLRRWLQVPGFFGRGRFIPDSEKTLLEDAQQEVEKTLAQLKSRKGPIPTAAIANLMGTSILTYLGLSKGDQPGSEGKPLSLYEIWLRATTTQSSDTEINLQTAEFSLRRNPMELLEEWVNDFNDFVDLFGPVTETSTFQCAVVSATTARYWCRLIGRRHDLQRWEADPTYQTPLGFNRPYSPSSLRPEEVWISPILDAWLPNHLPGAQLYIEDSTLFSKSLESSVISHSSYAPSMSVSPNGSNSHVSKAPANISSVESSQMTKKPFVRLACVWPPVNTSRSNPSEQAIASGIKEVIVTLCPTTIEVFNVVECGRKFYTELCYCSDTHQSFGAFSSNHLSQFEESAVFLPSPSLSDSYSSDSNRLIESSNRSYHLTLASPTKVSNSVPPSLPTLVISRNLTRQIGVQRYVPSRHLHGLVPASLLCDYEFWQRVEDGTIYGYQKEELIGASTHPSMLKISVAPVGPTLKPEGYHLARIGDAVAVVQRIILKAKKEDNLAKTVSKESVEQMELAEDVLSAQQRELLSQAACVEAETLDEELVHILINLKHVQMTSDLAVLREALTRIEDLAHVLVWSTSKGFKIGAKYLEITWAALNSKKNIDSKLSIDLIEFPRLGLSFRSTRLTLQNNAPQGRVTLHCDQHAGLYLSTRKISAQSLTAKLIQGVPNSILLENQDGELFLLVDAIAKPLLVGAIQSGVKSSDSRPLTQSSAYRQPTSNEIEASIKPLICPRIVLDRNDEQWLSNLGDARHYLYAIHSSRSFLFAPTPSSALYLLLHRFLDRKYEEVCKSAEAAHFFDGSQGQEECQIWNLLNKLDVSKDSHPDAHAARIKIWIAASGQTLLGGGPSSTGVHGIKTLAQRTKQWSTKVAQSVARKTKQGQEKSDILQMTPRKSPEAPKNICSWSIEIDILYYVRKLNLVSASCRLTPEEEIEALRAFPSRVQSTPSLHNRQSILQILVDAKKGKSVPMEGSRIVVSGLRCPAVPRIDDFDSVEDRSAVEDSQSATEALANLVGSITVFKRPEQDVVGAEATAFYIKAFDRSFKLFTEWHFFYELLTDSCPIRVLPSESTFLWGALLCRFLGTWDFQSKSMLMSLLRILLSNPRLVNDLPHLKDDRKHKLPLGLMMRSQETFQRFVKELQSTLKAKNDRGELEWPKVSIFEGELERHSKSSKLLLKPLNDWTNRWAVGPRIDDTRCSKRELGEVDASKYVSLLGIDVKSQRLDKQKTVLPNVTSDAIKSFSSQPLRQHVKLAAVIEYVSREDMRKQQIQRTKEFKNNDGSLHHLAEVSPHLPFSLEDHQSARTPLGKSTLKRLATEMKAYSQKTNTESLCQLAFLKDVDLPNILICCAKLKEVLALLDQLRSILASSFVKDGRFVDLAIRLVSKMINFPPVPSETSEKSNATNSCPTELAPVEERRLLRQWAFIFGKFSGSEPTITFDVLVSLLLAIEAEEELRRFNPFLPTSVHRDILSLSATVLFVVNRRSQICRALHDTISLIAALTRRIEHLKDTESTIVIEHTAAIDSRTHEFHTASQHEVDVSIEEEASPIQNLEHEIVRFRLLTSSLAKHLSASRHYMFSEDRLSHDGQPSTIGTFDPRFLVFEFAYNILLRKAQIELIQKFALRVKSKQSLCHQAIMGSGKTTVVAPLLALLLADGSDMVVQVVPHALLEFTRTVMQERFSAVIKKGVLTFAFSRYQNVTPHLVSALIQAKEKKAIVLATPTSIKSVFLKIIQLFHILDTSANMSTQIDHVIAASKDQFRKLRNALGKVLKLPLLTEAVDTNVLVGRLTDEQFRVVRRELDLTLRTLNLFKSSVLLLDEVDLILHPLKSELHWPIGQKIPLDFTRSVVSADSASLHSNIDDEKGLRWRLPWHILDSLFYVQCPKFPRRLSVPFGTSREAWNILEELREEVQRGLRDRSIQRTPHFVLLDETFYHSKLKIHLARWTYFGLKALQFQGVSTATTLRLLCLPVERTTQDKSGTADILNAELLSSVDHLQDVHIKMLNLCREWLNSLLPHVLQKVNRVGFGIMTPNEIAQQLAANPLMPPSRLLLAVPFIGKDSPSLTSEFAHPDVIIGLTILAYRYDGLRSADFHNALSNQISKLADGIGPLHERAAALEFISWITAAGGRVRGTARRQRRRFDPSTEIQHSTQGDEYFLPPPGVTFVRNPGLSDSPASLSLLEGDITNGIEKRDLVFGESKAVTTQFASPPETLDPCASSFEADELLFQRIWPLELISVGDKEQFEVLHRLLWKEPLVIKSLLFDVVFPLTLQHAMQQLSSSGQELGGDALFPVRLGFSGTPSELLPLGLGKTEFEPGTDGQVLHLLTTPEVVTIELLKDNWDVNRLLSLIAIRTDANAFIDAGALITGKSNLNVARLLLERGLEHIEGVVFLDEDDRQMILVRDGWRVMKLAQCGISLERRFTFYDQVHTTGQDIRQAPTAKAIITIGKDMTFRDLAQGAWRMRGIGAGQTLVLLIPPEVADLVEKNARQSKTLGIGQRLFGRQPETSQASMPLSIVSLRNLEKDNLMPSLPSNPLNTIAITSALDITSAFDQFGYVQQLISPDSRRDLSDVCAWLVIRGVQSESIQLRLLCQHNLFNIWRKNAYTELCSSHSDIGSTPLEGHMKRCLELFREKLDFFIPASVPVYQPLRSKLISLAASHIEFLQSEEDRSAVKIVLQILLEHEQSAVPEQDATILDILEAEITQEQEQEEEEEEEEQEQEQEKEQEQQKEQEQEPELASQQKYTRSDETTKPWKLSLLSTPPECHPSPGFFYPLSEFAILKKLTVSPKPLAFPSDLWVSTNHYDKKWSFNTFRRLKNVLVVMEYIPDVSQLKRPTSSYIKQEALYRRRLQKAFDLFVPSGHQVLNVSDLSELLSALEVGNVDDKEHLIEAAILEHIDTQRKRSRMMHISRTPTTSINDISSVVGASIRSTRQVEIGKQKIHTPTAEDLSLILNTPTPERSTPGQDLTTPDRRSPLSTNGVRTPATLLPSSLGITQTSSSGRDLIPINYDTDPFLDVTYNRTGPKTLSGSISLRSLDDLSTLDAGLFQATDLVGLSEAPQTSLCTTSPAITSGMLLPPTASSAPAILHESTVNTTSYELIPNDALIPKVANNLSPMEPSSRSRCSITSITFNELALALEELGLYDEHQNQRYFILLSLEEAEGVRAALHVAQHRGSISVVPECRVAISLRHVGSKFSPLDSSRYFIEEQSKVLAAYGVRQQTALACYRFLNSEIHFSERQVALLIRALQDNDCESRKEWFFDVRRCRRRRQRLVVEGRDLIIPGVPSSPALSRIFSTSDDISLVQLKVIGVQLRRALRTRGMSLTDGFRAFDTSRQDRLKIAQIFAGLRWLNVDPTVHDFQMIWRHIPKTSDGYTTEAEFVRAFSSRITSSSQETEASFITPLLPDLPTLGGRLSSVGEILSPQELSILLGTESTTIDGGSELDKLDYKIYERLKFKLQPHTTFKKIWEGRLSVLSARSISGTTTSGPLLSFWMPEQLEGRHRSITRRNRERVCLGHFGCEGGDILKSFSSRGDSPQPLLCEIEDSKASTMAESPDLRRTIDLLMPHPIRYKMVWRLTSSTASGTSAALVIWRPIPQRPSDFTAIGVCVTDSDQPPPLSCIRCVPRKWIHPAALRTLPLLTAPVQPSGQQLDKPISLGLATNMRLLIASTSSNETPFELKATNFMLQRDGFSASKTAGSIEVDNTWLNRSALSDEVSDLLTGNIAMAGAPPADRRIPRLVPRKSAAKGWF